jgi:hypothetical protein
MAAAGLGAAWLVLSRFPEVFFQTRDWRTSRKARVIRRLMLVGIALFGCLAAAGLVLELAA